jgi:subtilisin family serine protease
MKSGMERFFNWGRSILLLLFVVSASHTRADEPFSSVDSFNLQQLNWYNFDPASDSVQGASIDKTYHEILDTCNLQKKIIVAVIDGGVDIRHDDLQGRIWTNSDEIPDNAIDDDHNGYVDDIHGWNFLGNKSGENIDFENYEYVRIYRKYDSVYRDIKSINELPGELRGEYKNYVESKKKYLSELKKYREEKNYIEFFENSFLTASLTVCNYIGTDTLPVSILDTIKTDIDSIQKAVNVLSYLYSNNLTPGDLAEYKQDNSDHLDKKLNIDKNYRALISDNPADIMDTDYGNNDVTGPSAEHGTFVSGIIAAIRDNSLGINGIAANVQIMVLRAVPDGDEYDKDIALAIRYAVDNGANIINMSFGKSFSPQKKFVDESIRYAGGKNVLVIHSAGNDAFDIDETAQYPSKTYTDGTVATNFITVGATAEHKNDFLIADFSNYGKRNVDLFAPGVDMVSLYPGNKYNSGSGTSFSGPVVSGVAALIWSCYPQLMASDIKDILLQSVTRYDKLRVYYPDQDGKKSKLVKFSRLSQTGGIVNAYKAMLLADKVTQERKENQ